MPTILITGGTGTIGKKLTALLLETGYSVIVLSRHPEKYTSYHSLLSFAGWDVHADFINEQSIQEADYIIHLAGAGVAEKRWSKKRKIEIVESRVQSSTLLVKALRTIPNKVKAVVSASAIGWYGPDKINQPIFEENALSSKDFLGETCRLWEESIAPVESLGIRLVKLRTGIVLSNQGGAFAEFKKPLQYGIAAILSKGNQMISWIHETDVCNMYLYAIKNVEIKGVYNAVAPNPVTNKELTISLAKQLRKQYYIPVHVPKFILKLMLGEMSIEVLKSTKVSCQKIESNGFKFQFNTIESAIKNLLK
jgi:uncharacterized protein (TIGR01777 family)